MQVFSIWTEVATKVQKATQVWWKKKSKYLLSGPSGWGAWGASHPPGKNFCRKILLLVGKPCDLLRSLATCLQILQFARARVILRNRCPAFCRHYRINVRKCRRYIPWFFRYYEKGFQHAVGIIVLTAHPTIPTQPWNFSAMQTRMKNVTANHFLLSNGVKANQSS